MLEAVLILAVLTAKRRQIMKRIRAPPKDWNPLRNNMSKEHGNSRSVNVLNQEGGG